MLGKIFKIILVLGIVIFFSTLIIKNIRRIGNTGGVKSAHKVQEVKVISDQEKSDYFLKTNFIEKYGETPFNVYSDGAIVIDFDNGEILYQKNPDMKLQTASISKIMTAIITVENSKPDDLITISKTAAEQIPNKLVMDEGEKLKTEDLLYAMMMLSANDAAWALAEGTLGYDNFIKAMNDKATWLDLKNTTFTNPAGLDDPNHKSTAHDLGVITRYALKKYPEILKYMGTLEHSIPKTEHNNDHYAYHVSSMIKSYPGMDGAKTGYTWEAGHTFIGTVKRDEKRLLVIVFNSQDPNSDIKNLLDYGFRAVKKP